MARASFGSWARAGVVGAAGAAALVLALAAGPVAAGQGRDAGADAAGERLGRTIEQAIRAQGPFFTAEERALIERKCGYAPGSFDGYDVNMSNGVFTCSNGRRADDAEVRAMMAVAGPRIGRRVGAVMASSEVTEAISEVARRASEEALRSIDHAQIAREAAAAEAATGDALREARRSIAEARREADGEVARALREAEREIRQAEREAERARRR